MPEQKVEKHKESEVLLDNKNYMVVKPLSLKSLEYYDVPDTFYDAWRTSVRNYGKSLLVVEKFETPVKVYGLFTNSEGGTKYMDSDGDDTDYESFLSEFSISKEVQQTIKTFLESDSTYSLLLKLRDGEDIDIGELKSRSPLIDEVRINEKNPKKSMVFLRFEDIVDYFRMLNDGTDDLSDDDMYVLKELFLYHYSEFEITNYDNSYEDLNQGYLFSTFNDENIKTLKEILSIILPEVGDNLEEHSSKITEVLNEMFSSEIDSILYEYTTLENECRIRALREDIKNDSSDLFMSNGIFEKDYASEYITSVSLLVNLYEQSSDKSIPVRKLLYNSISNGDFHGYYDWMWESYCNESYDEELNRVISNELESIIEKIEDSDEFLDIDKYKEVRDYFIKNYPLGIWHTLPRDNTIQFGITKVNPSNNKVIITVKTPKGQEKREMTVEEFQTFINNYELF